MKPNLVNPNAVDATRLRSWLSCRRRFLLEHVFGLVRRGTLEIDLEFGKAMHAGFEAWAEGGLEASLASAWDASPALAASPDAKKNRKTLMRLFVWYDEHFKDDPLDILRLVDGRKAVEHAHSIEILDGRARLVSRPDAFVQFEPWTVYTLERKSTGSSKGQGYDSRWNPDIQITIQALVSRSLIVEPGWRFGGIVLESAHVAVGGVTFSRVVCERDEALLAEALGEIEASAAALLDALALVSPDADLASLEPAFPRNEASCALCRFKDICMTPSAARPDLISARFEQRAPWNPLHE